mmetsp:Transcript_9804/g.15062  ORF Transcript_9804/g.15062 Transcript_9804/m.15062 type:complete len:396 (-) Transcript_9804:144-1331(-)
MIDQANNSKAVASLEPKENSSGIVAIDSMHSNSKSTEVRDPKHETSENGSELTAASALTSLVNSGPPGLEDLKGDDNDLDEDRGDFKIPERFTMNGRKKAVSFPLKLMKILSCKEYSHIICWRPESNGRAFHIVDRDAFTSSILPRYFKQAKFSSFTRKLFRWGFERVGHLRGKKYATFSHEKFQKNRLDLLDEMSHSLCDNVLDDMKAPMHGGPIRPLQPAFFNNSGAIQMIQPSINAYPGMTQTPSIQHLQNASNVDVYRQSKPDGSLDALIELEVRKRLIHEKVNAIKSMGQKYAIGAVGNAHNHLVQQHSLAPSNEMLSRLEQQQFLNNSTSRLNHLDEQYPPSVAGNGSSSFNKSAAELLRASSESRLPMIPTSTSFNHRMSDLWNEAPH